MIFFFFSEQKEKDRNRTVFTPKNSYTNITLVRNPTVMESESLDFNCISIIYQLHDRKSVSARVSVNEVNNGAPVIKTK